MKKIISLLAILLFIVSCITEQQKTPQLKLKEEVENTILFLQNDCICDSGYINNALKIAKLINDLKEKYEY